MSFIAFWKQTLNSFTLLTTSCGTFLFWKAYNYFTKHLSLGCKNVSTHNSLRRNRKLTVKLMSPWINANVESMLNCYYPLLSTTAGSLLLSICWFLFSNFLKVTYLSNIGGENLGSTVRRILVCILTNDLAKQFNWIGKGTKEAFCKLRLVNVVHRKY